MKILSNTTDAHVFLEDRTRSIRRYLPGKSGLLYGQMSFVKYRGRILPMGGWWWGGGGVGRWTECLMEDSLSTLAA